MIDADIMCGDLWLFRERVIKIYSPKKMCFHLYIFYAFSCAFVQYINRWKTAICATYMAGDCVKPFDQADFISLNDKNLHFYSGKLCNFKGFMWSWVFWGWTKLVCVCICCDHAILYCYPLATEIQIFFSMIWTDNTVTCSVVL